MTVKIVPLTQSLSSNKAFEVAVIFSMRDDWHIYWQNPGDAGLATRFEWQLPSGFKIVDQKEPVPTRHNDEGIITFIHEKEAIYTFTLLPPDEIQGTSTFSAEIDWLECKTICKAGTAQVQFSLPSGDDSITANDSLKNILMRANRKFPLSDHELEGRVVARKNQLEYRFKQRTGKELELLSVDFFPYDELVYDIAKPVHIKSRFWSTAFVFPLLDDREKEPQRLHGVLVQRFQTPEGLITKNSILNQAIQP